MVQCWKMVNIKAFYSPFSTYSFAKTEVIPWCGPMFSVRSRELWPFYRLTLFEAQAEVIFFLRRWANTSQESWCRCVSLQLKCPPWFSILFRFVPPKAGNLGICYRCLVCCMWCCSHAVLELKTLPRAMLSSGDWRTLDKPFINCSPAVSVGELVCRCCLVSLSLSCKHFNFLCVMRCGLTGLM